MTWPKPWCITHTIPPFKLKTFENIRNSYRYLEQTSSAAEAVKTAVIYRGPNVLNYRTRIRLCQSSDTCGSIFQRSDSPALFISLPLENSPWRVLSAFLWSKFQFIKSEWNVCPRAVAVATYSVIRWREGEGRHTRTHTRAVIHTSTQRQRYLKLSLFEARSLLSESCSGLHFLAFLRAGQRLLCESYTHALCVEASRA